MQKLALQDVCDLLNKALAATSPGCSSFRQLLPHEMMDVLQARGISSTLTALSFWHNWECGRRDITNEYFVDQILGPDVASDENVIIVTDDSFKTGYAYSVPARELPELAQSALSDDSLYQPLDHVFYFPQTKRLILLHHDGYLVRVDLEKSK